MKNLKNMRLGSKLIFFIFSFFIFFSYSLAEDKILSSPLINLSDLKPSFEEIDESTSNEMVGDKRVHLSPKDVKNIKHGLDQEMAKMISEFRRNRANFN